jgi:cyclopropane fatty-acyl-phospholipid synthase-like methyltransferase
MKSFWQSLDKNNAADAILTGYKGAFKDMPVYAEVLDLATGGSYALDFGCGVGRNTLALSKRYDKVIGFDLPNMIELVPDENKASNITYSSEWAEVKEISFDTVLASLVFQHIHDDELHEYLKDLKTNKLILHSRLWMDDTNTQVLDIVNKYFSVVSIDYVRDPNNPIDDHFIGIFS